RKRARRIYVSSTRWLFQPTRSRARSLTPSSNRRRWKSMRSSSGPRRRYSNMKETKKDQKKPSWSSFLRGSFSPGVFQEVPDSVHNPMIPHTIVLEPGLVIYKIYNGYWFFGRPTLEELRQDLRAVIRKCRPGWDITTPELKAAWQEGRKELFYPYGKTYAQTLSEQD